MDAGTGLIDHIDGFIRQVPVRDIPYGEVNREIQRFIGIRYVMVVFVTVFDFEEYFGGFFRC